MYGGDMLCGITKVLLEILRKNILTVHLIMCSFFGCEKLRAPRFTIL